MTQELGKLFTRVAAVTSHIGAMETDKRNQQQRYDYISADKILTRVGAAMADQGLVVIPAVTSSELATLETTKGSTMYSVNLVMAMTLADSDGNTYATTWSGCGVDYASPDKAQAKAVTTGHKYFLMKLFNIGVGNEDGEHDAPPKTSARTNGHKPSANGKPKDSFEAYIVKTVGYFSHEKHVENAMKKLGIDKPDSKDAARVALAQLRDYASKQLEDESGDELF